MSILNNFLTFFCVLCLLFVSCSKDVGIKENRKEITEIVVKQNRISLEVGQSLDIALSGGDGESYNVSPNKSEIASAFVVGKTLTITGLKPGTQEFTISSGGMIETITVTVVKLIKDVVITPNIVGLEVNQSMQVTISGGDEQNYSISPLENEIVTIEQNDNVLNITAKKVGNIDITVSSGGKSASFRIAVSPTYPEYLIVKNNILRKCINSKIPSNGRVVIPNTIVGIDRLAFENCSYLLSVEIPNTITELSNYLFYNCENLSNVKIPNSVVKIGDNVFAGCKNLNNITLPENLTSIGSTCFSECKRLKAINLPNSINYIGSGAFWDCQSLTSIKLPNQLTEIQENTFNSCYKLSELVIPSTVTKIDNDALTSCFSLRNLTCYAVEPPKTVNLHLSNIVTVYVPSESVEKYKGLDTWNGNVIKPIQESAN